MGCGVLYDILRPLRRRADRGEALLDVLFCVLSGAAVFAFAMSADNGKLGTWELFTVLGSFLVYLYGPSAAVLRLTEGFYGAFFSALGFLKKFVIKLMKKFRFFSKKVFNFVQNCYMIKK